MLKFNFYSLLTLAVFSLTPLLAMSEVRFPEIPSKNKPLSVDLHTSYFRTYSNYTTLGQYVDLPNKNFFQTIALHPSLSYSPFPYYVNFEIFAKSFYASSNTLDLKRSVYRPTVLGAGFKIYHKIKTFYIGLEVRGGMPLYKNFFESPNEIILGDGSYFVEPGLWALVVPSKMLYIYFNSSFRYRFSSSLSGLLFNRLGGVIQTQYIDSGLAINTFVSLQTNQQVRYIDKVDEILKNVNGGSYAFYSVQPAVLTWTAWLSFKFHPVFTTLYFNLNTLGKNYARGFNVGLITKLKWNTKSSILRNSTDTKIDFDFLDNSSSSKKNSHFEEKDDPYSQESNNLELKQELQNLSY